MNFIENYMKSSELTNPEELFGRLNNTCFACVRCFVLKYLYWTCLFALILLIY